MAGPAFRQPKNLAAGAGFLAEAGHTAGGAGASQRDAGFDISLGMVDRPPLTCQRGCWGPPLKVIWRPQQIAERGWLPARGSEPRTGRAVLGG